MIVYDDIEKAEKKRVVYFAERYDGAVKIGTTRRLAERRKELEFLLGEIKIRYVFASSKFESELHKRYSDRWLHNETYSVSLNEIIRDVTEKYDEKDYIQVPEDRKESDFNYIYLGDFESDCDNISKLKMFKEYFGNMTFCDALESYIQNNKEYGFNINTDFVEDKTDLFISMFEPKIAYWLAELLLDYDACEIEHEYLIAYLVEKHLREKKCLMKLRFLNDKVQDLESKIAGFIEVSDTDGKNDKEIYQMVKKWIDGGAS